jgi:hypothetical protein
MPLPNVTITLSDPIEGHKGPIKTITLHEPKYPVVMSLGPPVTTIRTKEGAIYQTQDAEIIRQYAERMVDHDAAPVLHLLGMRDTLALQEAVIGFFAAARAGTEPKTS